MAYLLNHNVYCDKKIVEEISGCGKGDLKAGENSNWAASWQNQQNGVCAQWRLISAWAFCPVWSESLLSAWRKLPIERTVKTDQTGRLPMPGWSEFLLGTQSFCWFCHEAAQLFKLQYEPMQTIIHFLRNMIRLRNWFSPEARMVDFLRLLRKKTDFDCINKNLIALNMSLIYQIACYSDPGFLVWCLFYGPSTHLRSFRARSVTLTTLASLLCSLPVLSAHSFASNWQLLFLNQRKRVNGRRTVFMTKSTRMCRTWGSNLGLLACQADTLPYATMPGAWFRLSDTGMEQFPSQPVSFITTQCCVCGDKQP